MVGHAGIGALGRGNVRNVELKPQIFPRTHTRTRRATTLPVLT